MSADNPTNAERVSSTFLVPDAAPTDASEHCPDTSGNGADETTNTNDETSGNGSAQAAFGELISRSNSALSIRTSGNQAVGSETTPDDDQPRSVIHAPLGFRQLKPDDSPHESNSSSSQQSDVTIKSPLAVDIKSSDKKSNSPVSPPPLTTQIAPAKDWSDRVTPRAQTRQEVEALKPNPRKTKLEDIPETSDPEIRVEEPEEEWDPTEATIGNFQDTEEELKALRTALDECWTLCNTLASLSYIHRERLFNFSGKGDKQEFAWKCCWKLCQTLYDNRDTDSILHVRPTLDLCREFCQALFEVRARDNEAADSVLRVSFELNNHLYNTHDRNLPEAFRERTLDFYITLCHRLMKQRTQLAAETDSLLRACWSLAEMLFSIRQAKREGKRPDEELLGSAVQACWELCDLFREGWTQIRPDRGTPRASQTTFTQAFYQAKRSSEYTSPSNNNNTNNNELVSHHLAVNPETPTTIFDDTGTVAPDEVSVPNIVVLGHTHAPQEQWSSTSSTLSGYSRSSGQSDSSTHTVRSPAEDPNLTCLKLLIVRAAMNSGFQRGGSPNLSSFVKTLSSDSFGNLPWHRTLLENYKKLVVFDPAFRVVAPPARAGAMDVAQAVQAMVQHNGQYTWLRDLYRLVFGFRAEEAIHRKSVTVQT